jgi:hypothetical protein
VKPLCLVLALALAGQASAEETCADLLDGGVPGPAVLVPTGHVVESPAWLMPPARMCLVGQRLQACETQPQLTPWPVVLAGGAGLVFGAAVVLVSLWATGHLK